MFRGLGIPLILRHRWSRVTGEMFELVGEAYINGIMDGGIYEELGRGLVHERLFVIA